ncbi:fumarate reductase flavoprotein subunit [Spinactinospora alkalitolerans]|uniref:Fumarate reductase flavoprotein subunit n=1 Tax=Spinactinospora alkalitolerans TaxID=687207 RepID=A0A852TYW5_9ACTN|nr:FAD-dependent oxidoreductase [Spinactinospora alkalitolerans]NYE47174.1 fumarate reductase flavoprotein subunit [Spinactinospora alkalitolerans]
MAMDVDVAVVGGGACGTMTALRAARDPDLTVAVFEKSLNEGCNAQISSGSLAAGGTRFQREAGIEDSPDRHAAEILAASGDDAISDVVLAVCRSAPRYVEWMADELGYPIELGTDMPRAGMSVPRLHTDVGRRGGQRLMRHLRGALNRLDNVAFVDRAPVVGLLSGTSGVEGVAVSQNGMSSEVRARHVVLACDGFGANPSLMREHCAELGRPFYGGVSTSTGDALAWLTELGAAVRNMGSCLRHGLVVVGHGTRLNPALPFMGAALLRPDGKRFIMETSLGYSALAAVLQHEVGERALLVWDEQAMTQVMRSELMRESAKAGAFRRYPDEESLTGALALPPEAVRSSLSNVADGRSLAAPLYAAWVTHGVLATQGGAMVDVEGRVLTQRGDVIRGLRAGGGTAAGFAGPSSSGYSSGNGLLSAFGMGWRIGNALAEQSGSGRSCVR